MRIWGVLVMSLFTKVYVLVKEQKRVEILEAKDKETEDLLKYVIYEEVDDRQERIGS